MKPYIFIVNGMARSGKDTFVGIFRDKIGKNKSQEYSTVTCIKEAAKNFGWNGAKDEKSRKFLSDLKDLVTNYNDFIYSDIRYKIYSCINQNISFIFIYCREPDEIERYKKDYQAITLFIDRKSVDLSHNNHADNNVFDYNYDFYIDNNGSLSDLASAADTLYDYIIKN